MMMAIVASSRVAGKTRIRSLSTGCPVSTDIAEVAGDDLHIEEVLHEQRLVEPQRTTALSYLASLARSPTTASTGSMWSAG